LLKKELAVASLQRKVSHFIFLQGILDQKHSLFPRLKKIRLKGGHFDIIDVIEAESQAVLNILTEHNYQDAFKTVAEALGTLHTHGRGLLRG
jgi:hypothetical protein